MTESTIDLTFASGTISQRVLFCGAEPRWALTWDHIPIRIDIDIAPGVAQEEGRRYALAKLNLPGLRQALKRTKWEEDPNPLYSLQKHLEELLPRYCPKSRPSLRARTEWSPRAAELLAGARRAKRRYTAYHQVEDLVSSKAFANQLKHEVRRNSRSSWRRFV